MATARRTQSDLLPRILVAIPAVAFAIAIIYFGEWVFAAGIAALGLVCVHELCNMFARARPVRLAAMLAVAPGAEPARAQCLACNVGMWCVASVSGATLCLGNGDACLMGGRCRAGGSIVRSMG